MKKTFLLSALIVAISLIASAPAWAQDPATELSSVQATADGVRQQISDAEGRLAEAQQAAQPEQQAARQADARADAAEVNVTRQTHQVDADRSEAARSVAAAQEKYEAQKSDAADERSGAFGAAVLVALLALGVYGLKRWRGWTLPRWALVAGGTVLGTMFVGGIASGLATKSAAQPQLPDETQQLAEAAELSAEDSPTPTLQAAIDDAERLRAAADRADQRLEDAEQPANEINDELVKLHDDLASLADQEDDLQHEIEVAQQAAEEEAAFRAEATTIELRPAAQESRGIRWAEGRLHRPDLPDPGRLRPLDHPAVCHR